MLPFTSFSHVSLTVSDLEKAKTFYGGQYRLRVSDIRVFYDVTDEAVEVLAIVPKEAMATWLERYGQRDETKAEGEGTK